MLNLRLAQFADIKKISVLIQLSARKLGGQFYNTQTIETALLGAFGVDTQLIKDQTYYVIEKHKQLIACGGWSYRKTLFGSDTNNQRNAQKLEPQIEAAKIRAFFIHPGFSRLGLGKQLLVKCESQACTKGFIKTQLMATLSGIDFYKKNGYQGSKFVYHEMTANEKIKFLPMTKSL